MYEFQSYNPAQPQIITSFKGNQKLILGGYRYNIHHVKEGVKTWRCVCAKKLTGARSWCKGRAETWDGDSKGIPKGEHNHQTEHDLAELEFFKSQLIFAAIADSQADLNVLVEEAATFLSSGLSFGNRESMKKSLIVARKSAETGELKLGQQPHRSTMKGARRGCGGGVRSSKVVQLATSTANDHMKKTTSTGKDKNHSSLTTSTRKAAPSKLFNPLTNLPAVSASSVVSTSPAPATSSNPYTLNISAGSSNNSSGIGSSLGELNNSMDLTAPYQSQQFDLSNSFGNLLDASDFTAAAVAAAGITNGTMPTNNTSYCGVNFSGTSTNEQLLAAALFAAAMFGSSTTQANTAQEQQLPQLQHATNGPKSSQSTSKRTSIGTRSRTSVASQPAMITSTLANFNNNNNVVGTLQSEISTPLSRAANSSSVKRKSARVNGILQKLSNKAAAITPSTSPLPISPNLISLKSTTQHTEFEDDRQKLLVNVETQTDESALLNDDGMLATKEKTRKRQHLEEQCDAMEGDSEYNNTDYHHQTQQMGWNNKQHYQCCNRPKVICCCCCEDIQDLKLNDVPIGCKKRMKFEEEARQKKLIKEVKAEIVETGNNAKECDNNDASNVEQEKEEGEVDDEDNDGEECKSADMRDDANANMKLFDEMETELKLEIAEDNDEDDEEEKVHENNDSCGDEVENKKIDYDDDGEDGELKEE